MKNNKMIYSDYMGTMIPVGFTIRKVLFDKQGNEPYKICKHSEHYTWNETDLLYYSDETDDDMYMEMTPEDTVRDLQRLLIDAIPGFEFPRLDLYDYEIKTETVAENEIDECDFVLGAVWGEIGSETKVLVEKSCFNNELTSEEINILAILMMNNWLQR